MEVLECILTRQSIRMYDKKDVPNELIGQILEAGIHAPSAGNMQPWEFIVVKDKKTKKEIADAALRQSHVDESPVLIIVCADPEKSGLRYRERGKTLYCFQDTAAAIENMLLTAKALGLGGCWIGAFEEEKVKSILRIPAKLRPVAILSIGFPVPYEKPRVFFKKKLTVELVFKNMQKLAVLTGGGSQEKKLNNSAIMLSFFS